VTIVDCQCCDAVRFDLDHVIMNGRCHRITPFVHADHPCTFYAIEVFFFFFFSQCVFWANDKYIFFLTIQFTFIWLHQAYYKCYCRVYFYKKSFNLFSYGYTRLIINGTAKKRLNLF
jgi:hypothetical protein